MVVRYFEVALKVQGSTLVLPAAYVGSCLRRKGRAAVYAWARPTRIYKATHTHIRGITGETCGKGAPAYCGTPLRRAPMRLPRCTRVYISH